MTNIDTIQKDLLNFVLDGDENSAIALTHNALDQGINPKYYTFIGRNREVI